MKSGIIAVIFASLSMASLGIFSRKIPLDATVITFFRLLFGALFLALFLSIKGYLPRLRKIPGFREILNGAFLATFALCYFQGLVLTTMANAVVILYLAPVTATIFAHFFLKERLKPINMILILLALTGFAAIMEFQFDFTKGFQGIFYSLLAMIFYAAFIVGNRKISGTSVYNRAFYQLLSGALCLLPLVIPQSHELITLSGSTWLWLIAIGFFPGFTGILLAVFALEKLPTVTYGTLSYLEPIFVIIFGWSFFQENLDTLQFIGCVMILLSGILTGILAEREKKKD